MQTGIANRPEELFLKIREAWNGPYWTAKKDDHGGVRLDGGSGEHVSIRLDPKKPGMLTFTGWQPHGAAARRLEWARMSVSVSAEKPLAKLQAEVSRRLLEPYAEAHKKSAKQAADAIAAEATAARWANELAAMTGSAAPYKSERYEFKVFVQRPRDPSPGVFGHESLEVKFTACQPEMALVQVSGTLPFELVKILAKEMRK